MTKINTCTCIFKQQIGYLPKNLQIDQSFFASYVRHAMNHFVSYGDFYVPGTQDKEVTKSWTNL